MTILLPQLINRVLHGDCLEMMPMIPDCSIDMILTDLPYARTQNPLDIQIPFEPLWEQYKRIIKEDGVIALTAQGIFYIDLVQSNRKWFKYDLVWDKVLTSDFLNANRRPLRQHEQIAIFYKKQPTYNPQFTEGKPLHGKGHSYKTKEPTNRNYGKHHATEDVRKGSTEKYPTSIVRFSRSHPSVAKHPTEKPVELGRYLIRTYTNPGEVVLDSTCGSGSFLVAAMLEGRKFIGIEKNRDYCDIARDRLVQEDVQ